MTVELASDVLHLVTMQAFFKRYDYKHEVLVQAADGSTGVVFSFTADSVSCLFLLPSLPIVPSDLYTCMHTHTCHVQVHAYAYVMRSASTRHTHQRCLLSCLHCVVHAHPLNHHTLHANSSYCNALACWVVGTGPNMLHISRLHCISATQQLKYCIFCFAY